MNIDAIKANFEARAQAVEELRALDRDAAGRDLTAEERQKEDRLNATISDLTSRIQTGLDEAERQKVLEEEAERFAAITRKDESRDEAKDADAEALAAFLRGESRSVEFLPTADESRDLVKGTASAGGNTVPTTMYGQVVEHLIETSTVLRAQATVIQTSHGQDIQVPKTTSFPSAAIVAEAAAIGESDPAFGQVTLQAYKYAFMTQVSPELLADSIANIPAFLSRVGGRALGHGMGANFITGTGSSQPLGLFAAASTGKTAASASAITADEVIDLYHSVVEPYRSAASWVMRDATLATLRKLKSSDNQYLWVPGLTAGTPDTLLGRPVFTDPTCPAIATGAEVIAFGDLSAYFVRLAGALRIERSDEYAFANDLVSIRFIQRADGDLVDTNAVKLLSMA